MPGLISDYVPQVLTAAESARRRRVGLLVWCVTAATALLLLGAVVVAPLALAGGHARAARVIYGGFRMVCHQVAERSFDAGGFPLAVCARCTGLYAGAAAGLLFYPLARPLTGAPAPARGWLILAAAPTCLDFALGFFGIWANTHLSRFLTAALLGAAAALYIVPGLLDLGLRLSRWHPRPRVFPPGKSTASSP